ncbi:hypothetical protein CHARACLAT_028995 [Characodon lateralis]|uniref:Uncharacterized protein n=1 Tax=Characodon lateralis TaxID=208331 RepID=A0ABU7EGY3_9TELE|nr:hypothetical protein [Characodon lateralis]
MLQKHLFGPFHEQRVTWKQVSVMIGNERSISESFSRSQVRMRGSSPLCDQLRERIVQQLKNNFSQHAIEAKAINLQHPEPPPASLEPSSKVCCGLSPHFRLFLEIMDGPKRRRTIWIIISAKFNSQHL